MKVDCHCHILPGIDDGAKNLEEAVFLASWLVQTWIPEGHLYVALLIPVS